MLRASQFRQAALSEVPANLRAVQKEFGGIAGKLDVGAGKIPALMLDERNLLVVDRPSLKQEVLARISGVVIHSVQRGGDLVALAQRLRGHGE